MTREKLISRHTDIISQRLMVLWQNYFWNRNSNIKEINKQKTGILSKILLISRQQQIQKNIIIQILHRKGQILLGQEPTFNVTPSKLSFGDRTSV